MTSTLRMTVVGLASVILASCGGGGGVQTARTRATRDVPGSRRRLAVPRRRLRRALAAFRTDARARIGIRPTELRAHGWSYAGAGQPRPIGSPTPLASADAVARERCPRRVGHQHQVARRRRSGRRRDRRRPHLSAPGLGGHRADGAASGSDGHRRAHPDRGDPARHVRRRRPRARPLARRRRRRARRQYPLRRSRGPVPDIGAHREPSVRSAAAHVLPAALHEAHADRRRQPRRRASSASCTSKAATWPRAATGPARA